MRLTRDQSEALAWRVWQLIGDGRVADGLELLDEQRYLDTRAGSAGRRGECLGWLRDGRLLGQSQ